MDSPRLSVCLEGEARYAIRRGSRFDVLSLQRGEVVFAGPHCVMEPFPYARYLSLGLVFSVEGTRFLLGEKVPTTPGASGHRFRDAFHTARTLGDEGHHLLSILGGTRWPAQDRGLCRVMEVLFLRVRSLLDDADNAPQNNGANLRWQAACKFMEDHLHEPITREDVARLLRIHPNHVSRLFARQGGESFKARMTRLRLLRARELLRDPAVNISEVADACGFADPNYFARCFRKVLGTTPGRDRNVQAEARLPAGP